MKKTALGYTVAFLVFFTVLQIWPLNESSFTPATPWDILLTKLLCVRTEQLYDYTAEGCETITGVTLGAAFGELAGDAFFVLFVLGIYYAVRVRIALKAEKAGPQP